LANGVPLVAQLIDGPAWFVTIGASALPAYSLVNYMVY
jgi:hypothetical protein